MEHVGELQSYVTGLTAVASDLEHAVTASRDHKLRLWDLDTLSCSKVTRIDGNPSHAALRWPFAVVAMRRMPSVDDLESSEDSSGDENGFSNGGCYVIRMYDLGRNQGIVAVKNFYGHQHRITCLTFDDSLLVSGDEGGHLLIWPLRSRKKGQEESREVTHPRPRILQASSLKTKVTGVFVAENKLQMPMVAVLQRGHLISLDFLRGRTAQM